MAERITVYSSGEDAEVETLAAALARLEDVEIQALVEARLLTGRVSLPFIETEGGKRHFGVSAIERFADNQLAAGPDPESDGDRRGT